MSDRDEQAFRLWYESMAKRHDLNPNPDSPDQLYDYRAAFRAGAEPGPDGHWPSTFKMPGHPNEVVGGFNTRTSERVPGTKQASEDELKTMGWDDGAARKFSQDTASHYDLRGALERTGKPTSKALPIQALLQELMGVAR